MSEEDVETLKKKAKGLVLTDDYAPVENLLAPVVRKEAAESLAKRKEIMARAKTFAQARELAEEVERLAVGNKVSEAIEKLKEIPGSLSELCVKILSANLAERAKTSDGGGYNPNPDLAGLYYNLALALNSLGQTSDATLQMRLSAQAYRLQLKENPDSESAHRSLGGIMFLLDAEPNEMINHFQRAVELNPGFVQNRINLLMALESQGKTDDAISACQSAIKYMEQLGQPKAIQQLRQYEAQLRNKKSR